MTTADPPCQLYLVTPPAIEPAAFAPLAEAALDAAPVACLQLWLPDADAAALGAAAGPLREIAQARDTAFVLNGDAALARRLGCDGVHLDDPDAGAVKAARRALGGDAIVGASCGASRHAAMTAAEAGADYVSFGPVFDSATKGLAADAGALETLQWWAEMMEVPCVAVGGLTPENAGRAAAAGADFVCAVSAVWDHPDGPAAAVRAFAAALAPDGDDGAGGADGAG